MFCYLLIMLLAGLGSFNYVFQPLIDDAIASGSRNAFTKDRTVSLVVLTFCAIIIAPITLVVLLVSPIREEVKNALEVLFNE